MSPNGFQQVLGDAAAENNQELCMAMETPQEISRIHRKIHHLNTVIPQGVISIWIFSLSSI